MRRIAGWSLVTMLLLAAPASANTLPGDKPPPKSVAGARITWPERVLWAPGERVSVRVRSSDRPIRLSLVGEDGTVAKRTLRDGTFNATVPKAEGKVYRLKLDVGKRKYFTWLISAKSNKQPAPAFAADKRCHGYESAGPEATIAPQQAQQGDPVTMTLTNVGPGCVLIPDKLQVSWVRRDVATPIKLNCDGDVLAQDDLRLCSPPPMRLLGPGDTGTIQTHVPRGLEPGRYDVLVRAIGEFGEFGGGDQIEVVG